DPGPNLRAVLHHQGGGRGHRPRAGHLLADRGEQAPRGPAGGIGAGGYAFPGTATADRPRCRTRGPRMTAMAGIDPVVEPTGTGCAECEAVGGWWLHLRRCAQCGHIGCCDTSPSQHASAHAAATGHPVIRSFEPGGGWFWSYETHELYESRPALAPPENHPVDQPVPGPVGRVPRDWRTHLH